MAFTATFIVHGIPIPKGSMKGLIHVRGPRGAGMVPVLTPTLLAKVGAPWRAVAVVGHEDKQGVKSWQKEIRLVASRYAPPALLDGAVGLSATFVLPRPKSVSASKRPHPCVKPDRDKFLRLLQDALTGIIYADDAQVVTGPTDKVYGTSPGVKVTVWELDPDQQTDLFDGGDPCPR